MLARAYFAHLIAFLALLGPALAAKLYRLDFRSPDEIHNGKGFWARDPEGTGSVIEHVKATLGDKDPWISTTSDRKFAQSGATSPGNVYVYYIDPSGLEVVDTIKEFKKEKQEHPHPSEKEFSVKRHIPWENIAKWETFKRSKKTATTTREDWEKSHKGGSQSPKSPRSFTA